MDTVSGELSEETLATMKSFADVAGSVLGRVHLYGRAEKRSRQVAANLQQSIDSAGRLREQGRKRILRFGTLVIDPAREMVRTSSAQVRLTRTEFDLLYMLAENSGSLIKQEAILREVWGKDFVPQGKVVDVTMHRLRRKLAAIPEGAKVISTVRGQGYSFNPPRSYTAEVKPGAS